MGVFGFAFVCWLRNGPAMALHSLLGSITDYPLCSQPADSAMFRTSFLLQIVKLSSHDVLIFVSVSHASLATTRWPRTTRCRLASTVCQPSKGFHGFGDTGFIKQ